MKKATQPAFHIGTGVTAVIAVLPWISDFFVSAYVVGAIAGVWFATRWQRKTITYKEGAQIGFLSGFYGLLAASTLYDLIWQLLHYPLWQMVNAERLLALCANMVQDLFRVSFWITLSLQIVLIAIGAGAFAAPAGILAVKLFRRSSYPRA